MKSACVEFASNATIEKSVALLQPHVRTFLDAHPFIKTMEKSTQTSRKREDKFAKRSRRLCNAIYRNHFVDIGCIVCLVATRLVLCAL